MDSKGVPTKEEHAGLIRRLWVYCIVGSIIVFIVTGSTVLALFLPGHDSKKVVEVSTAIFQVFVLSYGMGFFIPAFMTSLFKMSLGVEMSRRGLEIGQETVSTLTEFQKEIKPVIADLMEVIASVNTMTANVPHDELKRLVKVTSKIIDLFEGKDDENKKKFMEEVRRELNVAESELERYIWVRVDRFLGEIWGNGQTSVSAVESVGTNGTEGRKEEGVRSSS